MLTTARTLFITYKWTHHRASSSLPEGPYHRAVFHEEYPFFKPNYLGFQLEHDLGYHCNFFKYRPPRHLKEPHHVDT